MAIKTFDQYCQDVYDRHDGQIVVLADQYLGARKKILHSCISCGHDWLAMPNNILTGYGCPECRYVKVSKKTTRTTEQFEQALKKVYGSNIQLIGKYRKVSTLRFKCYTCLNTFKSSPNILYRKIGCPVCSNQIKATNLRRAAKMKEVFTEDGTRIRLQGFEPQALNWILNKFSKLDVSDIVFDSSGEAPKVRYKVGRRNHTYYPDMYIPKQNRIIEVKSTYTLGLNTGKGWRKTQEKAKACKEAGYKFVLLLMTKTGDRLWLPRDWYKKSRKQVLIEMAFHNGIHTEEQYNDFRQEKEKKANQPKRKRARRPSRRTRRRRTS